MKIAATVLGLEKLKKAFGQVEKAGRAAMVEGLETGAITVHENAVQSIQARQSQGRAYKRGTKIHYASLPGKPPNPDRGELVPGIKWEIDRSKLVAQVGTNVKHGALLEVGTSKVAPRPWLLPALRKAQPKLAKLFLGSTFRNRIKG